MPASEKYREEKEAKGRIGTMAPGLEPRVADYEARVRASFGRQRFMETIGARLVRVAAGEVEIELPCRADLTQQHGFVHAGVVTALADTACGYAAFTLMPAGVGVLSVEYKINLLAPARGELLVARGRVVRPGRTLTVCAGEVFARQAGEATLAATLLGTMMTVRGRPEIED
jgi:uncharacterized protein (TIGR00369 family)